MRPLLSAAGILVCALLASGFTAGPAALNSAIPKGLVPVADPRVPMAYIRPGTDWSKYRTVEIRTLRIPDTVRDAAPNGRKPGFGESYVLGDRQVEKLQGAYASSMQRELAKAGYGLVTAAGPDTLILAAQVVQIRLKAPIESTRRSFSSPGRVYSQGGGSMIVAAIFADGESGKVLAVAADRSYPTNVWGINNSATNLGEARRAFNKWAVAVRERLSGLRSTAVQVSSVGPKSN